MTQVTEATRSELEGSLKNPLDQTSGKGSTYVTFSIWRVWSKWVHQKVAAACKCFHRGHSWKLSCGFVGQAFTLLADNWEATLRADGFFSGADLDLAWFSSKAFMQGENPVLPYILSNLCNSFSLEDSTASRIRRQFKASREYTKYEHTPVSWPLYDWLQQRLFYSIIKSRFLWAIPKGHQSKLQSHYRLESFYLLWQVQVQDDDFDLLRAPLNPQKWGSLSQALISVYPTEQLTEIFYCIHHKLIFHFSVLLLIKFFFHI